MIRALTCAALLALASCRGVLDAEPRFSEGQKEGISLALSVSPSRITPGDTARLTARVTNHTASAVKLSFGSGCQVLFFVENARGEVVEPAGGGWACIAVVTAMDLAPGETKTQEYRWTGRAGSAPLPAGSYRAYATLNATLGGKQVSLRTAPETIELR